MSELETCEHCKEQPAILIGKGPMIWFPEGRGMFRPEKQLCLACAILPLEVVWPITHPMDCRARDSSTFVPEP